MQTNYGRKENQPALTFQIFMVFLGICALQFSCTSTPPEASQTAIPNYTFDSLWPQFGADVVLGQPTGLAIDSEQRLYVFHRADRSAPQPKTSEPIELPTLLKLDIETGAVLSQFGESLFVRPHGLHIDRSDNLWLTDVQMHQLFKLNRDGEVLMVLGEAFVAGSDSLHFDQPTDVAVAGDGSFYVSDGYGNSRVVHFSPSGKYLSEWGSHGSGPGQFDTPHAIAIGPDGRVYVADRENSRIQAFHPDGTFAEAWDNGSSGTVYTVRFDPRDGAMLATDFLARNDSDITGSDVMRYLRNQRIAQRMGKSGHYTGPATRYHDLAVDSAGNIYVGDIFGNRVQRFVVD